jgi:hypothetical protein
MVLLDRTIAQNQMHKLHIFYQSGGTMKTGLSGNADAACASSEALQIEGINGENKVTHPTPVL